MPPSSSGRTRVRAIALALALLAVAGVIYSLEVSGRLAAALLAAASVTMLVGALAAALSSLDQVRSAAVWRLDWYTPYLRRRPDGSPPAGWLKPLRSILPQSWQSNYATKQRGWIRRFLRRLGPSWLASPVRRVVQGLCLLVFLISFFYVCWPYTAHPEAPAEVARNWRLESIDQDTGGLTLIEGELNDLGPGAQAFVLGASWSPEQRQLRQPMLVKASTADRLTLEPVEPPSPGLFELFLTSEGPWLVYDKDPLAWPTHYADDLARKERVEAELFLVIDPLVSLSTAIAARSWVWSLASAGCILLVCVLIPRGFCGYLCPLGTTIDLFDWAIAGRVKRFQVSGEGWWVHIKYYLLLATLVAAIGGVLISGFFSAIPVLTRGLLFLFEPIQSGAMRGWRLAPPMHIGHAISIVMFFAVLGLGFLRPRFWCKYVCPSGAVFSLGNLFRVSERKVESSCINCNKCVEVCPFDAIKPDFTTRTTDCTLCQTCAGVCPTHAIKFVERSNLVELKVENDPPTGETKLGRRGFLSTAAGGAAALAGGGAAVGAVKLWGAQLSDPNQTLPVRPPGSVPEQDFLQMCIRCGECFKACPNNVLQPMGFEQGLEGLWTPQVVADWAGCESSCNACGQVCPTGAIRALPMPEKKVARMGLAIVNEETCLPFAGREACDLCVQECNAAGYEAIEFTQVGTEVDDQGLPIEGSGFLAPVVLPDKCVGCGLCQTRCYGINVKEKHLLTESAIVIEAGAGKEDRLMQGSYIEIRKQEAAERAKAKPADDTEYNSSDDSPDSSPDENPFF